MIVAVAENPTADFSQDNGWVVLGKALVVFVFLVVTTLVMIWAERRVVGADAVPPGPEPDRPVRPAPVPRRRRQAGAEGGHHPEGRRQGRLRAGADHLGDDVLPRVRGDPVRAGGADPVHDIETPLQLTDLNVAVLFVLAVAAVGVYGIVLAGWSSGSTYPLLGGVRSSAQIISYEIAMGLALISVFLYAGSMSTSAIVDAQAHGATVTLAGLELQMPSWNAIVLLPAFVIYCIAMVGETNRAPFDLPEAEGELVGGFHTEYSSLKFALFFLAEYVNMVTVSAIATTLFLGGWRAPWPISLWSGANTGLVAGALVHDEALGVPLRLHLAARAPCPGCATTSSCASAGRSSSRAR